MPGIPGHLDQLWGQNPRNSGTFLRQVHPETQMPWMKINHPIPTQKLVALPKYPFQPSEEHLGMQFFVRGGEMPRAGRDYQGVSFTKLKRYRVHDRLIFFVSWRKVGDAP